MRDALLDRIRIQLIIKIIKLLDLIKIDMINIE